MSCKKCIHYDICQHFVGWRGIKGLSESLNKCDYFIPTPQVNDDIIKAKDAEIDRLSKEFLDYQADVTMEIAAARIEVIAEFAEMVKEELRCCTKIDIDGETLFNTDKTFVDKIERILRSKYET